MAQKEDKPYVTSSLFQPKWFRVVNLRWIIYISYSPTARALVGYFEICHQKSLAAGTTLQNLWRHRLTVHCHPKIRSFSNDNSEAESVAYSVNKGNYILPSNLAIVGLSRSVPCAYWPKLNLPQNHGARINIKCCYSTDWQDTRIWPRSLCICLPYKTDILRYTYLYHVQRRVQEDSTAGRLAA